jgi:hypothetical protein
MMRILESTQRKLGRIFDETQAAQLLEHPFVEVDLGRLIPALDDVCSARLKMTPVRPKNASGITCFVISRFSEIEPDDRLGRLGALRSRLALSLR